MKIKELIDKQNKTYKDQTVKSRCIKLHLNIPDQSYFDVIYELQKVFSRKIFKDLKKIDVRSPKKIADHLYLKEVAALIKKFGYTKTFLSRQIIRPVLEKYASYIQRNKRFPNYSIQIKRKATPIYNSTVTADKKTKELAFSFWPKKEESKEIRCSYKAVGTMHQYEDYISNNPGGHIVYRGNKIFYTARCKIPVKWSYQPEGFVGFDMNKTANTFLMFSQDIDFFGEQINVIPKTHPRLKAAAELEKELRKFNKQKVEKEGRSRIRRKIKKLHKQQSKLYEETALEIINYCKKNKLCICIDNLTCGKRSGTFGQDKVISNLVRYCENQGVPYVLVPTPYTTRLCNKCGHLHGPLELKMRQFKCEKCDVNIERDLNSALNIANRGKLIWENGLEKVEFDFKKQYNESIFKHK